MSQASFAQLNSRLTKALPPEHASQPQVEAFCAALEQVQEALDSDDAAALMQSSVAKTLFTKCIAAAVTFNRSRARPANDPEQQALFMTTETIESLLKVRTDLKLAHLEDALVKAGIVSAARSLLSVLLNTSDDVECRENAIGCLIGAQSRVALHAAPRSLTAGQRGLRRSLTARPLALHAAAHWARA